MKLAIADPPYPPQLTERFDRSEAGRVLTRSRARRYYGDGTKGSRERPADFHPEAAEWDDPARHRALIEQLADEFDGWAIATSADGLDAYRPLPLSARVLVWIKPNNPPSGNRIHSYWEAVILYPPRSRRSRRSGPSVPDVLTLASSRRGFTGAKPEAWTHWVLSALGYLPTEDTVADLFPGSGAVAAAVATYPETHQGAPRMRRGPLADERTPDRSDATNLADRKDA